MARYRNAGLFLLIAVLFGSSFPAIKAGLDYFPPLLFATLRHLLSGVLLLVFAFATTDDWFPHSTDNLIAVFFGGTFFIGGAGLLFVGQQFTTSGVAAIIYSLIPILTPVAALFLLPGERLTRRGFFGVLVGFGGVVIVIQPDPASLFEVTLLGQLLVFLAATSVTLGTVLVRRSQPPMSIVALTGWAMLIGASIQFGLSLATGESIAMTRVTQLSLLILGYLAVFVSGIGFLVYFTLLDRFGPLEINLVTYLMPVVAVIVGWLLLNEPITANAIIGFLVIVVGFALLKERELVAELAKFRGAAR